jgi:hypothetical protein
MMPNYVEIYFGSADTRDRVLGKVGAALGVAFGPADKSYADYLGRTEHLVLDFRFGHDLADDAGIPFGDMPYVLTVRDLQRGQLEEPAARKIFRQLEGLGYRPMYLVRGLTQIIQGRDLPDPGGRSGAAPP